MKKRHELKYMINQGDYLILQQRLSKLFSHDSNTKEKGEYHIRSLYFDTPSDKALMEKINGVNRREKFRLRMYNLDSSYIRLEKKAKENGLARKTSAPVTSLQVEQILQGDLEWMLDSESDLILEFYSKMKGQLLQPKTIVDYIREPFIYVPGNTRLTLDRDIRTGLLNTDFLNPELTTIQTFETYALLEVKFDEYLPEIVKHAIQIVGRQQTAFSKYAICRKYG